MCVCLMCRCVLSAEPLPWCFSPAAPLRITGRWEPAGAAPRAARVEAERFHAVVARFAAGSSAARASWDKDAARVCAAAPPFGQLWSPTNCRLRSTRALGRERAFANRSVLLVGDSLVDQLRRLLAAVNDAEALGLTIRHASMGLLPDAKGRWRAELAAELARADAAFVGVGAHYNLRPACERGGARGRARDDAQQCAAAAARSRLAAGTNLPHHFRADLEGLVRAVAAAGGAGGNASRVAWRESPPQHYDGGVYTERASAARACGALTSAAARGAARWREDLVAPIAARAFRVLPAHELAVPRADSHPPLDGRGERPCAPARRARRRAGRARGARERCDCTHYCLDSAVSAAGVSLALNLLADIFRAHALVPPPPDSANADCAAGHGVTFACRRGYKNAVDITRRR